MNNEIANITIIRETLQNHTANEISKHTGLNLSTIKKLKSGERLIEKLNLHDAICLTEFGLKNNRKNVEINIWK
ncbi:hypothetical protein [Enterococcus sp. DIV1420a]|uniref:hypothetical protein n=1 Tax=Enterococcus sp. DIV1420a TaxID=2774672 RepID=UPI003F1EED99